MPGCSSEIGQRLRRIVPAEVLEVDERQRSIRPADRVVKSEIRRAQRRGRPARSPRRRPCSLATRPPRHHASTSRNSGSNVPSSHGRAARAIAVRGLAREPVEARRARSAATPCERKDRPPTRAAARRCRARRDSRCNSREKPTDASTSPADIATGLAPRRRCTRRRRSIDRGRRRSAAERRARRVRHKKLERAELDGETVARIAGIAAVELDHHRDGTVRRRRPDRRETPGCCGRRRSDRHRGATCRSRGARTWRRDQARSREEILMDRRPGRHRPHGTRQTRAPRPARRAALSTRGGNAGSQQYFFEVVHEVRAAERRDARDLGLARPLEVHVARAESPSPSRLENPVRRHPRRAPRREGWCGSRRSRQTRSCGSRCRPVMPRPSARAHERRRRRR